MVPYPEPRSAALRPRRVVVYELNEVPWRILDDHVHEHPEGALARFCRGGATFTTRTPDKGHLSPWVTWPTMHRGVPNYEHGIGVLGQDPATFRHDPLWKIALEQGRTVGLFGSLQSWPPAVPREKGFHVPDTFARDARCAPPSLEPFQAFNLAVARESGRVVNPRIDKGLLLRAALRLPFLGVRPSTLLSAARQLMDERADPRRRYRRAVFQAIVGFDVFASAWRRHRVDYGAFFTNHVAGLMHRYWRARYPGDYAEGLGGDDSFYAEAIPWGMAVADRHLDLLGDLAERDPDLVVVLASSMGQHAIRPVRDRHAVKLAEPARLLQTLGYQGPWERRYAMEPQVPLAFPDGAARRRFESLLSQVADARGAPLFVLDAVDTTVSVTVAASDDTVEHRMAWLVDGNGARNAVSFEELGLEVIEVETPGTAYHVPDGSLVFYGQGVRADGARQQVSSLAYAPTILELLGCRPPPRMQEPSLVPILLQR